MVNARYPVAHPALAAVCEEVEMVPFSGDRSRFLACSAATRDPIEPAARNYSCARIT
jgi:hypothetical protein